jgi:preprotein translocase subunit SecG
MRNPLELILVLHRGKHKNLLQSTGGGQEQFPSLANASNNLQAG